MGGIVRYLVDVIKKAEVSNDDISTKLMVMHAIIGTFAGFISYLVVSAFVTSFIPGLIAAGLGSFGSYGTLFWLLEQAKKRLVIMDEDVYKKYAELKHKGLFDAEV